MKKHQDESSLELLLDTMCNTFGGVMFIAISLVVIMSMTSSLREKNRQDEEPLQSVEQLTATLEALKVQLGEAMARQSELAQQSVTMSLDPRLKQLSELAALEDTVRVLEVQTSLELQSLNAESVKIPLLQQKLQAEQAIAKSREAELEAAETDSRKLGELLMALRNEAQQIGLKMVFTTLTSKQEMPYFIALKDNLAWRIGPDDVTMLREANHDVESTAEAADEGELVTCLPRDGAGVPILTADRISRPLQQILSAVPRDRVPCFMVPPGSAAAFYALRESLKQARIFHGFMLQPTDDKYVYRISSRRSNYEY